MSKKSRQRRADDGAKKEGDPNEVVAHISITVARNGNMNVNGTIGDKVRAFGMLEVARDIIADWHVKEAAKAPATEK